MNAVVNTREQAIEVVAKQRYEELRHVGDKLTWATVSEQIRELYRAAAIPRVDALIAANLIPTVSPATAWDEGETDDAVRRIVQVVEDNKAEGTAGYFIRKVPADLNYQRDWYAVAAVNALITGGWSITRSPATTKGN